MSDGGKELSSSGNSRSMSPMLCRRAHALKAALAPTSVQEDSALGCWFRLGILSLMDPTAHRLGPTGFSLGFISHRSRHAGTRGPRGHPFRVASQTASPRNNTAYCNPHIMA